MEFFFERLFEVSRARWWQVLASVIICAVLAGSVAMNEPDARQHLAGYALGGGALGLLAAVVLLWVDAGQRAREARQDHRLTLRERVMVACLIFGFALGAFSLVCAVLMGILRAIEFFARR